MVYCEHCGAANDIMNQYCHRCGHALAQEEASLAPVAVHGATTSAGVANLAPSPDGFDLGAGLEVPEWLLHAAAQTPEVVDPSTPAFQVPPPGFLAAEQPSPTANSGISRLAPPEPPAPAPSPPEPGRDGASSMSGWPKTGLHSSVHRPAAQSAPDDVTDTASFISENDLPEWIRQIAAADTAKLAEEERVAAEASRALSEETPRRVALPGETPSAGPASNPWLNRGESTRAADAWAGTKSTGPLPSIDTQPANYADQAESPRSESGSTASSKTKKRLPAVARPGVSRPALPKLQFGGAGDSPANSPLRYVLIGGIAVLIVLIIAMVL